MAQRAHISWNHVYRTVCRVCKQCVVRGVMLCLVRAYRRKQLDCNIRWDYGAPRSSSFASQGRPALRRSRLCRSRVRVRVHPLLEQTHENVEKYPGRDADPLPARHRAFPQPEEHDRA